MSQMRIRPPQEAHGYLSSITPSPATGNCEAGGRGGGSDGRGCGRRRANDGGWLGVGNDRRSWLAVRQGG